MNNQSQTDTTRYFTSAFSLNEKITLYVSEMIIANEKTNNLKQVQIKENICLKHAWIQTNSSRNKFHCDKNINNYLVFIQIKYFDISIYQKYVDTIISKYVFFGKVVQTKFKLKPINYKQIYQFNVR